MESKKMVLKNLFTGQQWRNRHREQTYGHRERGGEGEKYGRVTGNLTLPYLRQPMGICCMAQETQTGFCINLEEWDGEGDGREAQEGGDICIPMTDSC